MILEEREYKVIVGKVGKFVEIYKEYGLPIILQYLPEHIGHFSVEFGATSNFVHMWKFEDLNERNHCREALYQDLRWKPYLSKSQPLILETNVRILKCL